MTELARPDTASDTGAHPVYDLLPAVHRIRDAELDYPLQKLLRVVEEELGRLRADVDGLYDDWFVETCAEWVVPYIGALLGVPPLNPVPGIGGGRSLVANTLGYRRRSGTAAALELVARDVTGWPAHAVEYFALLVTTQHLDHVRLDRARTVDLRDADGLAAVGTPFDPTARNAEVRHIDSGRGRYNLPDIGLHLWRLGAFPVKGGHARKVGDEAQGGWTFDPAGRDRRLFRRPTATIPPDDGVGPDDVPAPLTRPALLRALTDAARAASDDPASVPTPPPPTALPGPDPVLAVRLFDAQSGWQAPARLIAADLSQWTRPSQSTSVAVDPVLGRLTVPLDSEPRSISVDYAYGFPGDVGAGPHDRRGTLAAALGTVPTVHWSVAVSADAEPVPGRRVPTIGAALALWNNRTDLRSEQVGVIAITDSATYRENLEVVVPSGDRLVIVAATVPTLGADPVVPDVGALAAVGVVPHLVGDIRVRPAPETTDAPAGLVLDGLSVEGDVHVEPTVLTGLVVADCTLLHDGVQPGGWIRADGNRHLAVRVLRTIAAGARLGDAETLAVADSILDAGGRPGGAIDAASARADISDCTILGTICVRILTASNTIFRGRVEVGRLQEGCVRFSFLPVDSRTPRRYLCQPTPKTPGVAPVFTSTDPVDPAFGQLAAACPPEIAQGADDEGEMGVYHDLQQLRRMTNLTAQLDRYLRFGLEAGTFFAT